MVTRETNGSVGSPTGSGLGASRPGTTGSVNTGSAGGPASGSTAGSVRDTLSSTADQGRREAEAEGNRLIGAARSRARSAFEHQQHRIADSIGSVAEALHQAANQLNEKNQDVAARYTDTAAERIEQFADSLRNRDVDELVNQAEQYARRQPEVFIGGAIAVGFVLARFLRSSGDRTARRYERRSYGGESSYRGQPAYASRDGYGVQTGGTQAGSAQTGRGGYGSYGSQSRYGQTGSGLGSGAGAGMGNTGGAGAMERNTGVMGSPGGTSGFSGTTSPLGGGTSGAGTAMGAQRPGDPARPNPVPQGSGTASTVRPDDRSTGSTPPRGSIP